jgi:hypothetical protein
METIRQTVISDAKANTNLESRASTLESARTMTPLDKFYKDLELSLGPPSMKGEEKELSSVPIKATQRPSNFAKVAIWITVALCLIAVVAIVYLYGGRVFKFANEKVFDLFGILANWNEPWKTLVFLFVALLVQVLGIPIATLVFMVLSFSYGSLLKAVLVGYLTVLAANTIMYFFFRKALLEGKSPTSSGQETDITLSESQHHHMKFLEFLGSLLEEYAHQHPLIFNLVIRALHMPDYAKMYIIVKYRTKYWHMIIPCAIVDFLNVFLYCFLGSQVKSRLDMVNSKSFSEKSLPEKLVTVAAYVMVAVQLGILTAGYIYTRKKYQEYEGRSESTPLLDSVRAPNPSTV